MTRFVAIVALGVTACATGAPRVRPARDVLHPYGDGCRFVERAVAHDEAVERWASPDRIAAGLDGVYVGRTRRGGGVIPRPRRIEVVVEADRNAFRIREVVSRSKPQERILCHSTMLVPLTVTLRMRGREAQLHIVHVTYDGSISAGTQLPRSFADDQHFGLWIPTNGDEIGGSFRRPLAPLALPTIFTARRRPRLRPRLTPP